MTLHEDLGPNLTATVITTGLIAFLTMGLRIYTRLTNRNWGLEDWVMLAGCLPMMTLTIVTTIGSYYGIGAKDSTFARPGNQKYIETAYFYFFLYEVFYCTSIIFVKLSIAFMLNRIAGNKKVFVYTNYGIMGLCASVNLASALYIIFQCNPVEAAWKAELMAKGTHCEDQVYLQNVYYFCSSVNIFTDWATALMPIPILWNVQMNRNTKISVAGVLGLGIFTSISGLVRMSYTVNLTSSVDYLYGLANILIWGYAEPALGMIVGNIATLRPLFRRTLKLGSDDSAKAHSDGTPVGSGMRNRSHPYKPFDTDFELGTVPDNNGDDPLSTQGHGGRLGRNSTSSDNESQKQILEKTQDRSQVRYSTKGIVVSKQVEITRS
ncbi:hypothetical protein BS50DRAFT_653796 [Corynespora cassiicola Philippines]|uniref:Rhodopsin domain-containing protein n=1 Tax=Corynespora cassiicola Philippines TaxID=1448308 RepID=A0A2T2P6J6_CORCC|nr:hypothetical protein BS50DRAFT_653796 [Corynespora cassiicola Philippines]